MGRQKPGKPRRARVPQNELDAAVAEYRCPSGCHAEVSAVQDGDRVLLNVCHDDDCPTLAEYGGRVIERKQKIQDAMANVRKLAEETGAAVIVTDEDEPWNTADRISLT